MFRGFQRTEDAIPPSSRCSSGVGLRGQARTCACPTSKYSSYGPFVFQGLRGQQIPSARALCVSRCERTACPSDHALRDKLTTLRVGGSETRIPQASNRILPRRVYGGFGGSRGSKGSPITLTFELRSPESETQSPMTDARNPRPEPEARSPKLEAPNPKPGTRNPQTEIRNPKHEIRNLEPETRN